MKNKKNLVKKSTLYLTGVIDEESTVPIIEDILKLNEDETIDDITLIINSVGGDVGDAFALIDIMELSKKKIRTIGTGFIASCGLLIFMTGKERLMSDKAMILSHQFSGGKYGKYHELVGLRKLEEYLQDRIIKHYKRHTKLSKKVIDDKLLPATDIWLTPKESVKYNLADKVINKYK